MEIKNIIIIVISILILIIYLQKGNNETFTVDYNWQQPTVKCSENQNKIYINADSNNYSIINVNESECQKNCENQEDCEMYLMSDENTCNLYNNVSKITEYCEAGSGHSYYGKVKSNCPSCFDLNGNENYKISLLQSGKTNSKIILGTVKNNDNNYQPISENRENPLYETVYVYTKKEDITQDNKYISQDINFYDNWKLINFQFKYYLIQNVYTGRFLGYGNLNNNENLQQILQETYLEIFQNNSEKIVYLSDNNLNFDNLWIVKRIKCNSYIISPYLNKNVYLQTTLPTSNNFVNKTTQNIEYSSYGQITVGNEKNQWIIKPSNSEPIANMANSGNSFTFNGMVNPVWILKESNNKWYSLNKSNMIGSWGNTNVISNSSMSVSFWINIPSTSPNWTSIFHVTNDNNNCCNNGNRVPALWLWPNSTQLYLSVGTENNGGNFIIPPTNSQNTSPKLGINKPTFITFTFEGKNISMYINGILKNSYKCPSNLTKAKSEAQFYCPDPWYSPQKVFTTIKNFSLYDKTLSLSDVNTIYEIQKEKSTLSWILPCTFDWYSLTKSQNIGKWGINKIIPSSNFMSFSFWINISQLNTSNWTSIFHITNNDINCCNVGNRVPAVWLYPNSTQLYVVHDQMNKGNTSISSKTNIGLNNYTFVTVTIDTNKIIVYFNGIVNNSKTFSDTLQPAIQNAQFYCPDSWHPGNQIYTKIKTLTFYNSVLSENQIQKIYKEQTNNLDIETIKWTLPQSLNKWYDLNQSNLIGQWNTTKIPSSNSMSISFWINIKKLNSNWSSILHITNQNINCCNVGNRVPALWLWPNSTQLLLVTDQQNKGNTYINSKTIIPLNKKTLVTVTIDVNKVSIYFNNQLNNSYTYPSNLENAKGEAYFYCPNPWYSPQQSGVSIKNLTFYSDILNIDKIQQIYDNN
jgi:hypothetical protein